MNPDIAGNLTPLTLCAKRVAVGAGTQTFAGVDLKDFIGNCKITIAHNELSGSGATSIQYSLLDSADNTTFAASAYLPTVAANTAASPLIEITVSFFMAMVFNWYSTLLRIPTVAIEVS